jgi:predicted SnoaL-like aldol condensation-catalyzing enzyme
MNTYAAVEVGESRAAMRRIIEEVINDKNLDAAYELFSERHELHPETPGIGRGPEGMKQAFAGLHQQFPDVQVTIDSMAAEADIVAVRLTFSGTDSATGEPVTWPEMVFTRFAGGKAAESWEITGPSSVLPA